MNKNYWGFHLILDCADGRRDAVTDGKLIADFARQLVKDIDMVAYGEPQIVHFGKGDPKLAGWTVVQLIETSNIVAHFNDLDGSACIDVFSCKPFSAEVVLRHVLGWFDPEEISTNYQKRLKTA